MLRLNGMSSRHYRIYQEQVCPSFWQSLIVMSTWDGLTFFGSL
uniref:Uncharacterized protein n=1 Tax=Arundo donax TaxID=35708 RepID=A0A0A9EU89_ARUDO